MRLWWLTPWLIMLAGCQAAPSVLPAAEPRPAPECRWEAGDTPAPDWVRRALTALENEGFVVRHTALGLGLVSADRTQVLPPTATSTTTGRAAASMAATVWAWAVGAAASPPG